MNVRYIINMLGKLLFIEALLMLAPFIVAIIYKENTIIAFGASMAILLMVGGISLLFPPKNNTIRAREGLLITGLAWILMSLFGALPLWLSGDISNYLDALFEVVSGFTTTGASVVLNVEIMSYSCLFWRSFTHFIGGMGVSIRNSSSGVDKNKIATIRLVLEVKSREQMDSVIRQLQRRQDVMDVYRVTGS